MQTATRYPNPPAGHKRRTPDRGRHEAQVDTVAAKRGAGTLVVEGLKVFGRLLGRNLLLFPLMAVVLAFIALRPQVLVRILIDQVYRIDRMSPATLTAISKVAVVVSIVLQAVVICGVMSAVLRSALQKVAHRKVTASDDRALAVFGYVVAVALIVAVGSLLLVLPGLIAAFLLMFVPLYASVRQGSPFTASVRTACRCKAHTCVAMAALVPLVGAGLTMIYVTRDFMFRGSDLVDLKVFTPGLWRSAGALVIAQLAAYLAFTLWAAIVAVIVRWDTLDVQRRGLSERLSGALLGDMQTLHMATPVIGVSRFTQVDVPS